MRVRWTRGMLLLLVAAVPGWVAAPGWAADHGDGWLDLGVVPGLDLAEGPPYPATPVEVDTAIRVPGETALPAGRLELGLTDASDAASGAAVALTGSALDNAQSGEPGDMVTLDVFFVPAAPPADELPDETGFEWGLVSDPGSDPDTVRFVRTFATLPVPGTAETTVTGDRVSSGTALTTDYGRIEMRFDVDPDQPLEIAAVEAGISAPDDLSVTFVLRRTGGGEVDPAKPLFRLTMTSVPVQVPALPRSGVAVLAGAVLTLGVVALLRRRRRSGGSAPDAAGQPPRATV